MKKISSKYLLVVLSFLLFNVQAFAQKKGKKNTEKSNISNKYVNISSANKRKGDESFFDGQKEKIKENFLEALKDFEQALKFNPNIDAAWFEISQINLMQKDYKSSLINIQKAIEVSPDNIWYQEFYGQMLSASGDFDKASKVFKNLRKQNPNTYDYYYDEAFFLLKQNKDKEAIKIYNELENIIGVQEELSMQKYKLYLKDNNAQDAEKELKKLSDAFPNNLNLLNKLAKFQLLNNEQEKAVNVFKAILKLDSNNTSALLSLADYYKSEGDNEKYKEYSKKAFTSPNIGIDTKIAVLYNYITAFQNKETDNLDDAFEYIKLLSEVHPDDAKTWAIYGDIYNLNGQAKEAIKKYKQSLLIQQDVFSVWQQMFFLSSDLKDYDDLIIETDKAKELFPNQAMVYFFNGFAHQQKKNSEKAIKAYERGRKMSEANPVLQAQFHSNLGETYNNTKDFDKSDQNFDKALTLEPNNQYVLNNYSYYLSLRNDNLDRALEMSSKSLELSPDNPTYLDTYAWILFKQNKFLEARQQQEKAIKLTEKPSAEMYDHLGDILFKLKKSEEAKKYWQLSKDSGKNSDVLNKKIETGLLEN